MPSTGGRAKSPLTGPRAKFNRGYAQLRVLNAKVRHAIEREGYSIPVHVKKYPHRDPTVALTLVELSVKDVPVLSIDAALDIGEILHNLRGALDHAAWQLSHKKGLSDTQLARIAFPVLRKKPNGSFKDATKEHLPGAPMAVVALAERYQPYRRTNHGRAIRRLRLLTNMDKHRRIIATPLFSPNSRFTWSWRPTEPQIVQDQMHIKPGQILRPGTELQSKVFVGRRDDFDVTVKAEIRGGFTLPRRIVRPTSTDSGELFGVLGDIAQTCGQILDDIEASL